MRLEKEAEQERIRREKEILEAQLMVERMEREQEIRRRSGLFRNEADRFFQLLGERLEMRAEQSEVEVAEQQDFADAVSIMEETERLKAEELERARQRKLEEIERQKYEARLERERIEREKQEEQMRLLLEEERRQAELLRQDMNTVAPLSLTVQAFEESLAERLNMRAAADEAAIKAEKAKEEKRSRRKIGIRV